MAEPVLEFRSVTKLFGAVRAVDGVSFAIQSGEIFTLLGPSGCGKTTTLRLVAGLEEPDDGEILLGVPAPPAAMFSLRRTSGRWEWFFSPMRSGRI
jgi:ABC-type Fe3+/spermidine/putrescine transport system ATPase subunit